MATVVNIYAIKGRKDPFPADAVYIGRGSVWGNPFVMKDKSQAERDRVIAAYKKWLWHQIKRQAITKEMLIALDGKRLACYCAPQSCHGDVIVAAIKWAKETT